MQASRHTFAALLRRLAGWAPVLLALFPGLRAAATSLPEERADALYHLYEGGGQTVQGPAVLMRKNFAERASVSAGYTIDAISGASIDVITNASPYKEERRELDLGADYLYRDTLVSLSYISSIEHDYWSSRWGLAVSQDMFDNRTTVTLAYNRGHDTVGEVHTNLHAAADHDSYSASLSQVINPTLIGTLSYEALADDGFLENPYRSARVQGGFVQQAYPGTRFGQAVSVKLVKSWSRAWSTRIEARYYHDTWQVNAYNVGISASQYIYRDILLDESYRYYRQNAASFYSDDFAQPETYMSRDKELAEFHDHSFGVKLAVPLVHQPWGWLSGLTMNFAVNYILIRYNDFTDVRSGGLYGFNATVAQAFLTARY
jgi:hypothetical protein